MNCVWLKITPICYTKNGLIEYTLSADFIGTSCNSINESSGMTGHNVKTYFGVVSV